jgi:hypothetical protein
MLRLAVMMAEPPNHPAFASGVLAMKSKVVLIRDVDRVHIASSGQTSEEHVGQCPLIRG